MLSQNRKILVLSSLSLALTVPLSATAQNAPQVTSPANPPAGTPPSTPATAPAEGFYIHANNGQTQDQQARDRYECHNWAVKQSGFDPTQANQPNATGRSEYERAMSACLEGRGYTVHFAPPPTAAPYPPAYVARYSPPSPALDYHPLFGQIGVGYTATAGVTNQELNGGPNIGLGLTWFPSSVLPVGLRLEGSYSWFGARAGLLAGSGFTSGHEDVYGGNADLQINLRQWGGSARVYLFGGAGEYQERRDLRQVSLESGTVCTPFGFFCGFGYFPAVTAVQHYTSPWHDSWNAGAGAEFAIGPASSFFVEARYQRNRPNDANLEFVPISIGVRF